MQPGRSPVAVQDLVRTGLLAPGQELRFMHRGRSVLAVVSASGTLLIDTDEYRSPSTAATAVSGTSTNGWRAWRAQQGGEWTTLDALRQRLLAD